jgi:predicted glycosyltransferase
VQEQLIRARLLAAKGYFDLIEPEALKPDILIARVLTALKPTPMAVPPLDLDGLPRVVQRTAALLEQEYE